MHRDIINNNNHSFDINNKPEPEIFKKNIIKNIYSNNKTKIEENKNSLIINKMNDIYQKLKKVYIKKGNNISEINE